MIKVVTTRSPSSRLHKDPNDIKINNVNYFTSHITSPLHRMIQPEFDLEQLLSKSYRELTMEERKILYERRAPEIMSFEKLNKLCSLEIETGDD